MKGVIDLGSPETPKKRRYRVLRIPTSVVEKYALSKGGRVTVPITEPRRRKQTKPRSEDELTWDLATLATEHGTAARRTLERIAERARAMTYVSPEDWELMVFFDDEG